jgi:hypothetical protein
MSRSTMTSSFTNHEVIFPFLARLLLQNNVLVIYRRHVGGGNNKEI